MLNEVNMVNAPIVARERGMEINEVRQTQRGVYETYVRLTVKSERQERSVAGTVFSDGKPRFIQIKGINMDAGFAPNMLYVTNKDRPGFIGRLGTLLGNEKVNIANFNLGRAAPGDDAISLVEIDEPISDAVLEKVGALDGVVQARRLTF
jgi:D-3-phosphoglycerate dehydrogenase